jgi:polyisoprenoid-binding protein YceI
MKKLSFLFLASAIAIGSFAQTTWKADKMHTQVKFDITHLGINTVSGAFTDFEASVTASKPDFSDAVFEMTAQSASINTGVEPRNNHLKSAEFFDVATFPTLTFKSTSMKKAGKDKYILVGDLTMHGITKSVTMDLWYRGTITNPMSKKLDAGFKLTGKIARLDFGIGPKYPAPMLSEEVTITADGEFGKD